MDVVTLNSVLSGCFWDLCQTDYILGILKVKCQDFYIIVMTPNKPWYTLYFTML